MLMVSNGRLMLKMFCGNSFQNITQSKVVYVFSNA